MKLKDMGLQEIEKFKAMDAEEFLAFAGAEGIELGDDELDAIAGGGSIACFLGYHGKGTPTGNTRKVVAPGTLTTSEEKEYICQDCGNAFWAY